MRLLSIPWIFGLVEKLKSLQHFEIYANKNGCLSVCMYNCTYNILCVYVWHIWICKTQWPPRTHKLILDYFVGFFLDNSTNFQHFLMRQAEMYSNYWYPASPIIICFKCIWALIWPYSMALYYIPYFHWVFRNNSTYFQHFSMGPAAIGWKYWRHVARYATVSLVWKYNNKIILFDVCNIKTTTHL